MQQARFWSKVKVIHHSKSKQCWDWQGGKLKNGYGMASLSDGKCGTMLAHRYVASLREDIEGKVVMHTCDNPSCVRPDHLVVGTWSENSVDSIKKNRWQQVLTETAVEDIRTKQISQKAYGKKYGITEGHVGAVQRGDSWSWKK